jgi:hypothetical protein
VIDFNEKHPSKQHFSKDVTEFVIGIKVNDGHILKQLEPRVVTECETVIKVHHE